MHKNHRVAHLICISALIVVFCFTQVGCSSLEGSIVLGLGVVTAVGGMAPSSEIEQIYYLGAFDPQEQVPPAVYRVRVRGQASFLSMTEFASGWVQAELVDSLGSHITLQDGKVSITKTGDDPAANIGATGRKMMLFGPEGFREAPKNHRLVVLMGSSPENYFKAVDQSLSVINTVRIEQRQEALEKELFIALSEVQKERIRLKDLERDLAVDLPRSRRDDS